MDSGKLVKKITDKSIIIFLNFSMTINNKVTRLAKYYSLINYNYIFNNKAINRYKQSQKILNNNSKNPALEILKKNIENIKNCELKKNATQIVFADGNPDANLMIIGEGPGANEDLEGCPFVGRAGQLLDKMLKAINLDRKEVYITNVVNFRPPANRKPTPEEISRYLPFLKKHVEIISPKIILLLGSTAMTALLNPTEVISKVRGKWFKYNQSVDLLVSYHPAFLMRQPDQKKMAWIDLKMIREKLVKLR